tara:strand:+ start:581 stop:958 length:378 start_codon:yes stop_codon:yes gene_type:complete
MSIYRKDSQINEVPAYAIFERAPSKITRAINVVADEELLVNGSIYYCGSVVSYALSSNDCPIAAVANATRRGNDLHWINSKGSCISSGKTVQRKVIALNVGDSVRFEGHVFTIGTAPNNNLSLLP